MNDTKNYGYADAFEAFKNTYCRGLPDAIAPEGRRKHAMKPVDYRAKRKRNNKIQSQSRRMNRGM